MNTLQIVSIVLETVIMLLALSIGMYKGRVYGYGLSLTFAVYVYYDVVKMFSLEVPNGLLPLLFFMATVSALASVWALFKKG